MPPPQWRHDPTSAGRHDSAPLDGNAHAYHRGLCGRELARQLAHICSRNADYGGDFLRRKLRGPLPQFVVSDGVFLDIIMIDEPLGDDHVDHAKRQRCIGAGPDAQMPIGALGGPRRHRIDYDNLGAVRLRLGDKRPVV
jgi:hypothetical protein